MKLKRKKFLMIVILFLIFILGLCSYSTASSCISIKKMGDFSNGEIYAPILKCYKEKNNNIEYLVVSGDIQNKDNYEHNFLVQTNLYNEDIDCIGTKKIYYKFEPNESIKYNSKFSQNELNDNYKLKDVAYYEVVFEKADSTSKTVDKNMKVEDLYDGTSDFVINDYNVDVQVNEDNSYDVLETLNVKYINKCHGIYRKIPTLNNIVRADNSSNVKHAKISNIKVSTEFEYNKDDSNVILKIGDSNKYKNPGDEEIYQISYKYSLGKDPLKDKDEFYFNLIGDDWDTMIGNATFKIEMPKEFNHTKVGFTSGKVGSYSATNIKKGFDGNLIVAQNIKPLNPNESVTIRVELPEGYFKVDYFIIDAEIVRYIIVFMIFMIVGIILWWKYGKDEKPEVCIEYLPPKDFNSAEVEFLYKGISTSNGAVSLIFELANKGYLKIEETDEECLGEVDHTGFKITKLKEYNGNNRLEKIIFNGIFKKAKKKDDKEVVFDSDLDDLYKSVEKINSLLNNKKNKNKIFKKIPKFAYATIIIMIIAVMLIINIKLAVVSGNLPIVPFMTIFGGIAILIWTGTMFGNLADTSTFYVNGRAKKGNPLSVKIFITIWSLGFGGIPFIGLVCPVLVSNPEYIPMLIAGIITMIVLLICVYNLENRNEFGTQILGRIEGFREFLEDSTTEDVVNAIRANPNYYYDVLPYICALNISDVGLEKFEELSVTPYFRDSQYIRVPYSRIHYLNSSMISKGSAPLRSGSGSSSSSSSGGGGCSGGGSGGGGGGSW